MTAVRYVDVPPPPDDVDDDARAVAPDPDIPFGPPLPPGELEAVIEGRPYSPPTLLDVAADELPPAERAQRLLAAHNAPALAVATLAEVMADKGAPAGSRVSAADSVLDRTPGFGRRQVSTDADARALSELPLAVLQARLEALAQRRADLLAIPSQSREIVPGVSAADTHK